MPAKAYSKLEAVIGVVKYIMDDNIVEEPDGRILDSDGDIVCDISENKLLFDGGYFKAKKTINYDKRRNYCRVRSR